MLNPDYPKELRTLSDHLRKKRLDLGLMQKEVAERLGADDITINHWETHRISPSFQFFPKIIEFLGYVPYINIPKTQGEKIIFLRQLQGISQERLAKSIGIDPTTLSKWERDKSQPSQRLFKRLERELGL